MADPPVADSLEMIIFAGVAMTTVAIASARPGFDLTFPQWRVVVILGDAPEGARISDVARRVGVTLPATSRQLHRLERRGLVTVTRDERDRRAVIARLTVEGERARASIIADRKAMIVTAATPLESDPATRRELARVAEALRRAPITNLRDETNGGSHRGPRPQTDTAIDTSPD
jgi:DNA-binding MarR family transcriptional regulator